MDPLEQKIIDRIKEQGPITFEAFMDMALYYPGLGYYTSKKTSIGREGDFYTSSHLHLMFGAMLGKQLEEMWDAMGRPSDFHAVEIGAGAGWLCKDIQGYLRGRDIFDSLNYTIVELDPVMADKQKVLLADLAEKVKWISSLSELKDIRGCIFSNELLDAFPVHMVEMDKQLKEIYVSLEGGKLIEQLQVVTNSNMPDYFKLFSVNIPDGYRTEINLRIRDWLRQAGAVLSEGFILTIDYGYTAKEYYDEERSKGTLLCYHRHEVNEEPFQNIGQQDITAHVNFSSLKLWGEDTGMQTLGYCPQGTYLVALGIDEAITELYGNSPDYEDEVRKIKGLIFPQGMGESHQVMIQYKGDGKPELRGFSMRNQAGNL
ncbi:hypothetical protein BMS3Abin10_02302 [bacterium BMS3Abin10]|nr:hypothetical protein BMS3Abin10_02302 [bacterium BMS3Abin10]GBE38554.1 hypothetical protein BMS3Bbin08_01161 [bacterium BMS3Bbin08]HDH50140.1 hypothetical protein [Nitrospirota bacterium]HDK16560.1 hypothetical protein [Nitrospirota bacterium]